MFGYVNHVHLYPVTPSLHSFISHLYPVYINDLLLSLMDTDICNYADDTTIHACHKNLDNVIARIENDSSITIQWFADNFMKLNTNKCHLLILGRSYHPKVKVNIGDSIIENCCDRQKTHIF